MDIRSLFSSSTQPQKTNLYLPCTHRDIMAHEGRRLKRHHCGWEAHATSSIRPRILSVHSSVIWPGIKKTFTSSYCTLCMTFPDAHINPQRSQLELSSCAPLALPCLWNSTYSRGRDNSLIIISSEAREEWKQSLGSQTELTRSRTTWSSDQE